MSIAQVKMTCPERLAAASSPVPADSPQGHAKPPASNLAAAVDAQTCQGESHRSTPPLLDTDTDVLSSSKTVVGGVMTGAKNGSLPRPAQAEDDPEPLFEHCDGCKCDRESGFLCEENFPPGTTAAAVRANWMKFAYQDLSKLCTNMLIVEAEDAPKEKYLRENGPPPHMSQEECDAWLEARKALRARIQALESRCAQRAGKKEAQRPSFDFNAPMDSKQELGHQKEHVVGTLEYYESLPEGCPRPGPYLSGALRRGSPDPDLPPSKRVRTTDR